uniref:Uncharacterized protein n=1 Tax=Panagrolaimus davidi TaxID=227884 RepID=A0A914Q998_9BILA
MSPQTLTCDTGTAQYTYTDGGGIQQQIATLDCVCDLNPCPTLTGSMVTVSTPTSDAACTYTATATCINPREIQYNGAGATYMSPQTLTCDAGTSQYTYDNAGTPIQVNTIDCICAVNPCPTPTLGAMASLSTPTADATCTYTADAMCTPTTFSLQFNGSPPPLLSPQALTCDTGLMQYTYDNAGTPTQVNLIDCVCDVNPCPTVPAGTKVLTSPPMGDGSCEYTVMADCMKDPSAVAVFRFNGAATDVIGPLTWTCDPTTMQYTYDNAGTPTQINTVECVCGDKCFVNRGPTVAMGPEPLDMMTCIYTRMITCDPGYTMVELRQTPGSPGDFYTPPTPMRCPGGIPNWQYELTPGNWVPASNVDCRP